MNAILSALDVAAARQKHSHKFATIVFTIATKYAALCQPHVDLLVSIASAGHSSMAKTTMRAVEKLRTVSLSIET
jgi:hypothetical protein